MNLLAIDPGTVQSAFVIAEISGKFNLLDKGILPNQELLKDIETIPSGSMYFPSLCAIEFIQCYGMAVGREVFETIYWTGKFAHAFEMRGIEVKRFGRQKVKAFVTGIPRAKDADVRRALMLQYGEAKKGCPLEGVKKDIWAALAVAHYVCEASKLGKLEEW